MGWMAAIPMIASLASGLFGKKKSGGETINAEQMMPDWQSATGEQLSSWIQNYLKNYAPGEAYTGQLTAPATGQELTGLDQLTELLKGPATGDVYAAGKQQLLDTMGGRYANPNESPWIKSMLDLSKMNLQDLITQERGQRGARGTYYTKAGVQAEGKLGERTQTYLNDTIGKFMQEERNKQFEAAGMAPEFEKYGMLTAPLARVQASQDLGGLLRTIDQSDLEAKYQDFIRQRKELSAVPGMAQDLYSTGGQYGLKSMTAPETQGNNALGNILGMISKLNFSKAGSAGSSIWDIFK